MSYYWFNRKELLQKAHDKCHKKGGKEKAKKYYQENKEAIKREKDTSTTQCQKKKEIK